jgi:hypothetical protein
MMVIIIIITTYGGGSGGGGGGGSDVDMIHIARTPLGSYPGRPWCQLTK